VRRRKQQKVWLGDTLGRGLHRSRNQNPWAIKSSSVLVWSSMELAALRRAECRRPPNCTLTLRPLDRELKQLKLAHISQLANNGEYLNSGEIWQNKPGGSAIAPIPTLGPLLSIKLGSQCLWLAKKRWRVQATEAWACIHSCGDHVSCSAHHGHIGRADKVLRMCGHGRCQSSSLRCSCQDSTMQGPSRFP
jgi:hypothetical protein